jgi:heme A synthase
LTPRFARFARLTLGTTVAVVLFGAWVRISGSGAGCGQHWPTCHGEIVHLPQSIETAIELTHRATSGLVMLLAIASCIWSLVTFPRGHLARLGAGAGLVFMITEALIGARLVLLGLVGSDASIPRAVIMPMHLTNTFLLTAALALAAWAASDPERPRPTWRAAKPKLPIASVAVFAMLAVSTTGAVTALGDTLFPVDGPSLAIADHVAQDQRLDAHALERWRWVHPAVAIAGALATMHAGATLPNACPHPQARRAGRVVVALVAAQVCAGALNIALSAPGWLQIVHLAFATAIWIALWWLLAWVFCPTKPGAAP